MKYYVDHSDGSFPQIQVWSEEHWQEPLSITQARKEVDDLARGQIEHWQMIRKGNREVTGVSVVRGEYPY